MNTFEDIFASYNCVNSDIIQFLEPSEHSIILRSGKSIHINDFGTSEFYKDLTILVTGNDIDILHNCEICFPIFSLFEFLEVYYKIIRGEEKSINEDNVEMLMDIYTYIREKLEDFIESIENKYCKCITTDEVMDLYEAFRHLQYLSELDEYVKFNNYTGYGLERGDYRICHLNFFKYGRRDEDEEEDDDEREEDDGIEEDFIIIRDFSKVKDELIHWLRYFKQEHQFIIDTSRTELLKYLNKDCVGEILKFLS